MCQRSRADEGFLATQVPEHVQKGYEKAQAAVALRTASEAAVAPGKDADSDLLAAYMAYTKLEEAQGDPARVQVRRTVLRPALYHLIHRLSMW